MEKVGGMFNSDKLQAKGAEKRSQAAGDSYGRSNQDDSYGSGNQGNYGSNDRNDY